MTRLFGGNPSGGQLGKPETRLMTAILLAGGVFWTQSHLLPLFGWSFLLLFAAWVLARASVPEVPWRKPANGLQWTLIIMVMTYLTWVLVTSTRMVSAAYLISSMACGVLAASTIRRWPGLMGPAIRIYLWVNVAVAIVGAIALFYFKIQYFAFVDYFNEGYYRFRGLSLEPHQLGLAINAIYIFVLFSPRSYITWRRGEFALTVGIIWGLALLTLSMFTLPCLALWTIIYSWTTKAQKIKVSIFISMVVLLIVSSGRFERIIAGEDNSANLRTWGALVIAKAQIDKNGIAGSGLGSSRTVLADEPGMGEFAAQDVLALPNIFATALVEGGYLFAFFFFSVILFSSGLVGSDIDRNSWRCRVSMFLQLFLLAISGSYLYDAQFWSISGMFYVLARARHRADRSGQVAA